MSQVVPFSAKGYVRLPQVLKVIPVGKSTWWAGVKEGRFPPAVKLGRNTTAWKVEDIELLMTSLAEPKLATSSGKVVAMTAPRFAANREELKHVG